METIKLNNGIDIPCMGIGPGSVMRDYNIRHSSGNSKVSHAISRMRSKIVYVYKEHKYVKSLVHAIKLGYRLIDYSAAYGTGELLTKAIIASGVDRKEFFITSRVTNKQQYAHKTREAVFSTLEKMGLSYIDLYMFHWPVTDCFVETYKELEKLYDEGYIRAIGVANCHQHHLDAILNECHVVPAINQIEVHPLFSQKPLINYCKTKGITVEAYTPLARNDDRLYKNLILRSLSEKYHKSIPQIILRWDIQQCIIPVPRSGNPQRQLDNISIFDFNLTEDEMKSIDSININSRLRFDPDNVDFHSIG